MRNIEQTREREEEKRKKSMPIELIAGEEVGSY